MSNVDSLISKFLGGRWKGGRKKGGQRIPSNISSSISEFWVEGGKVKGWKANVFVVFCVPNSEFHSTERGVQKG